MGEVPLYWGFLARNPSGDVMAAEARAVERLHQSEVCVFISYDVFIN